MSRRSERRGPLAPAAAPSLHTLQALDSQLQALRTEARTGLGSHEVRRTLIREHLRPSAPPRQQSGAMFMPSSATQSSSPVPALSTSVEELGLPAALLEGDLPWNLAADGSSDVAMFGSSVSAEAMASHPASRAALEGYQALCSAAEAVDYDVDLEDALQQVEQRDEETGMATVWRARRRYTMPLLNDLGVASSSLLGPGRACRPSPEGRAAPSATSQSRCSTAGQAPFASELYEIPLPKGSTAKRGAAPRSSTASSLFRPTSRASAASISTTITTATTTAPINPQHASQKMLRPSPKIGPTPLSSVGTAVVQSSAASFATALRQRVKAHRQQASDAGRGAQGLQMLPFGSSNSEDVGEDGFTVESPTWRARMTDAVTLVACSACHAWFTRPLRPPQQLAEEEASSHRCCPRCGHTQAVSGEKKVGEGPSTAMPRWLWAPARAEQGMAAVERGSNTAPSVGGAVNVSIAQPGQPRATRSMAEGGGGGGRHDTATGGNGVGRETCGTDSVGFAEDVADESFAALVARIRTSRQALLPAAAPEAVSCQPLPAKAQRTNAGTETSISPLRSQVSCCSAMATQEGAPLQSSSTASELPSAFVPRFDSGISTGPAKKFLLSLRMALNQLYFDELWESVKA